MILTTTDKIHMEGVHVIKYLGVASGSTVKGINAVRDLVSKVTDFMGGKSGGYTKAVELAQKEALENLQVMAAQMGGNAVIGISVDFEFIPNKSGMLMATATGTVLQLAVGHGMQANRQQAQA